MVLHLQFPRHGCGYYLWAFSRMSVDTIPGCGNGDNTALDFDITREKGKSSDTHIDTRITLNTCIPCSVHVSEQQRER